MNFPLRKSARLLPAVLILLTGLYACSPSRETTNTPDSEQNQPQKVKTTGESSSPYERDRMVPNPIDEEIPNTFSQAVSGNTRTFSGEPGEEYWQQKTEYEINVELVPAEKKIIGSSTITYHNNSPDTLELLHLELAQNAHKEGVLRKEPAEVTGGINLDHVEMNGNQLPAIRQRGQTGYVVNGTLMSIVPEQPVLPGESVTLDLEWDFTVPRRGASGRMGYNEDNLFFIAYWYPQMRVYDDVIGWFTEPFRLNAEFYHGFADYRVDITAPEQWIVAATGALKNGEKVLTDSVYHRLREAHQSDEVLQVVDRDDFGNVTRPGTDGKITWSYSAENVRDFAFSVTRESNWEATRSPVGDLDSDGRQDYTHIDVFYRDSAPLWKDAAKHSRHSIRLLSDYTGLSYPWPHMTAVEGGGIIGGGMEFPMITLIGSYQGQSTESLYAVIAHELAHMWVPMQISNNERRYSWIDEGTTTFNENQAKKQYYPDNPNPDIEDFQSYLQIAGTDFEGPIMRRSDFHYNGFAFGAASYPKPASMLVSLRGLLGSETFNEALQTFLSDWRYKHPYPWDLFNTFENVSGRDLDWFWRSWYFETWVLDQTVADVSRTDGETRIIIEDLGQVPMPADILITLANGQTLKRTIEVGTWLKGATRVILHIDEDSEVTKVKIDPEHLFPDTDRSNNIWER